MPSNSTDNIYSSEYRASAQPIPALPADSADGTYVLKATASSGTIAYAWVAEV